MSEWIAPLVIYGLVTLFAVTVPLLNLMDYDSDRRADAEQRQRLARIAATNIVWPVWIVLFIINGLYRWIEIARTGE